MTWAQPAPALGRHPAGPGRDHRALTLVVNQRERQAFSSNATVEAVQYQVGSDYGGIMVRPVRRARREVREGEKLFTISSFALQKDLANGLEPVSTSAYELDAKTGLVTYLASADGTLDGLRGRARAATSRAARPWPRSPPAAPQFVDAQFRLHTGGLCPDPDRRPRRRRAAQPRAGAARSARSASRPRTASPSPPCRSGCAALASPTSLTAFAQPGSPSVTVTLTLHDDGVLAGPTDTPPGVPAPGRVCGDAAVSLPVSPSRSVFLLPRSACPRRTDRSSPHGAGRRRTGARRPRRSPGRGVVEPAGRGSCPSCTSRRCPRPAARRGSHSADQPVVLRPGLRRRAPAGLPAATRLQHGRHLASGSGCRRWSPPPTSIVGSHQQDVTVDVEGGASTLVSAYDVASVTLADQDADGEPLGRTTDRRGLSLRHPRRRRAQRRSPPR